MSSRKKKGNAILFISYDHQAGKLDEVVQELFPSLYSFDNSARMAAVLARIDILEKDAQ
jgi:hypothetical protein